MDLNQYQKLALTTAIFPSECAIEYCTLGLVGEVAELLDINRTAFEAQFSDVHVSELGDVCWYIAVLAHHVGIELSAEPDHYEFVQAAPGGISPMAVGFELAVTCGLIANKAKKVIRDGTPMPECWAHIQLGRALAMTRNYAEAIGVTLEFVLEANIKKLADRKARGVIKGSGDTR